MEYNLLIGLPLFEAENILKSQGKKYIVKKLQTYKLNRQDTDLAVKISASGNTLTLYVCGFMCKKIHE